MLAYGTPVDALDEYLKIGKSTALECLDKFAQGVIEVFSGEYMRAPTVEDVQRRSMSLVAFLACWEESIA